MSARPSILQRVFKWFTYEECTHIWQVLHISHHEDISFGTPGIFSTKVTRRCRTCGHINQQTLGGIIPPRVFQEIA